MKRSPGFCLVQLLGTDAEYGVWDRKQKAKSGVKTVPESQVQAQCR